MVWAARHRERGHIPARNIFGRCGYRHGLKKNWDSRMSGLRPLVTTPIGIILWLQETHLVLTISQTYSSVHWICIILGTMMFVHCQRNFADVQTPTIFVAHSMGGLVVKQVARSVYITDVSR